MGLIFFLLIWVLLHLAVAFFDYRAQKFKELALTGIGRIPITLAVIVLLLDLDLRRLRVVQHLPFVAMILDGTKPDQ
jgi:hypothetical protein